MPNLGPGRAGRPRRRRFRFREDVGLKPDLGTYPVISATGSPPGAGDGPASCTISRLPFSALIAASVRLFITTMLMRRFTGLSGADGSSSTLDARPTTRPIFSGSESAGEQRASRRVGAIGRELPVRVVHCDVRPHVRVAADADAIRHAAHDVRELVEDVAAEVFEARAAEREHRAALVIDDLDAHAFRRHVEQDLILELRERLALVDGLVKLVEQSGEPFVVELLVLRAVIVGTSSRSACRASAALRPSAARRRDAAPCRRRA